MSNANHFDVIVLGAGAAGLMCAAEAGKRGQRTLLLEHNERPGRKIVISGGGRCNFTNTGARPENYLSANPHFARSAMARYTPADFIALVERHGIRYHEKTLGQLFCDDSAMRIVTMLLTECENAGAELRLSTAVVSVRALVDQAARFEVETSGGMLTANSVVVATGGLSIAPLGATGIGYEIAQSFGHTLLEPTPALVPLVFSGQDRETWSELSGLSTTTVATAPAAARPRNRPAIAFTEKMLITHRGLSGPAVLQISSYWQPGKPVAFDLAPKQEVFLPLTASTHRDERAVLDALAAVLPVRLAKRWLMAQPAVELSNSGLARLEAALHAWTITPAGTEGFAKAEVTTGGVNTAELDARTMESKRAAGLYFIGEVVDVTGWLGGYNFQWAWASAVAAAEGTARA